jgi:hypothetical protein
LVSLILLRTDQGPKGDDLLDELLCCQPGRPIAYLAK